MTRRNDGPDDGLAFIRRGIVFIMALLIVLLLSAVIAGTLFLLYVGPALEAVGCCK